MVVVALLVVPPYPFYLLRNRICIWTKDYISQPLLQVAMANGMQVGVPCVQFIDHALKRKLCLDQEVDAMVHYLELWVREHHRGREATKQKDLGSLTP